MKNIIKKIEEFNDEIIYLSIFNKLTANGKNKNYSSNSNGIFFELNKIDVNALVDIDNELIYYKRTHENAEKINNVRETTMDNLRKEVLISECKNAYKKSVPNKNINLLPESFPDETITEEEIVSECFDSDISDSELFGECSDYSE
jgi:hypothetical protein